MRSRRSTGLGLAALTIVCGTACANTKHPRPVDIPYTDLSAELPTGARPETRPNFRPSSDELVAAPTAVGTPIAPITVTTETVVTHTRDPEPVPQRDFGAELGTAMGDLSGCANLLAAGGSPITITVSANVVATGRVSRTDVSGVSPQSDLGRCILSRANGVSFRAPVDSAPITATASFTMTPAKASAVAAPQWKLPDGAAVPTEVSAEAPSLVLPARVD